MAAAALQLARGCKINSDLVPNCAEQLQWSRANVSSLLSAGLYPDLKAGNLNFRPLAPSGSGSTSISAEVMMEEVGGIGGARVATKNQNRQVQAHTNGSQ